ncbi:hypothetical protein OJAV_G00115160 [Oryzias javanicus]|uniref:Uncharacterized protein n=1 Tax=Oryzias javanicus TaxID=123683 RepID=A0A437CX25_ORYJA|nr:hypothetical protein OJAV_G00115160 [Oryzias javanicus]
MSRMLQDHDGVQSRSDGGSVCGMFNGPLPAHRRQSPSHRGLLVQEEAALARLRSEREREGLDRSMSACPAPEMEADPAWFGQQMGGCCNSTLQPALS